MKLKCISSEGITVSQAQHFSYKMLIIFAFLLKFSMKIFAMVMGVLMILIFLKFVMSESKFLSEDYLY